MSTINIKDVAKYCKTSVSTVSRVLNGRPDVNPETRQRVLDAIASLDFVPNNSARNLVRTESDRIGVVVRGFSNMFFSQIVRIVEDALYRAGYSMELHHIQGDADEVHATAMLVNEKRLCGVLFLGGQYDYTEETMHTLGVPYVCVSYTNTFGSLDPEHFSSVSIDDREEARNAVQYLVNMGHRRIAAVVSEKSDRSVSELRFDGYRQALSDNGIPYDPALVVESGNFSQESAFNATSRLLGRKVPFSALFTVSDMMALAAVKAMSVRGIRVPEDCSVIGIDGIDSSNYSIPTLTTMVQPTENMARESVDILIGMIRGNGKNRHVFFPAEIRKGGSVIPFNTQD